MTRIFEHLRVIAFICCIDACDVRVVKGFFALYTIVLLFINDFFLSVCVRIDDVFFDVNVIVRRKKASEREREREREKEKKRTTICARHSKPSGFFFNFEPFLPNDRKKRKIKRPMIKKNNSVAIVHITSF